MQVDSGPSYSRKQTGLKLSVAAATIDETEQMLLEGIELHIAGMREDGLLIPVPAARVKQIAIPV